MRKETQESRKRLGTSKPSLAKPTLLLPIFLVVCVSTAAAWMAPRKPFFGPPGGNVQKRKEQEVAARPLNATSSSAVWTEQEKVEQIMRQTERLHQEQTQFPQPEKKKKSKDKEEEQEENGVSSNNLIEPKLGEEQQPECNTDTEKETQKDLFKVGLEEEFKQFKKVKRGGECAAE